MRGVPAEQQAASSSAAVSPPAVLFIWTASLQGSRKSSTVWAEIKQVLECSSKSPLALQANPNLHHHSDSLASSARTSQTCHLDCHAVPEHPWGRDATHSTHFLLLEAGTCSSACASAATAHIALVLAPCRAMQRSSHGQRRGGCLPPWCLIRDPDWFDNVLTTSGRRYPDSQPGLLSPKTCRVSPTSYSLGFQQHSQNMGCATSGITLLQSLNESDYDVVSFWSSDLRCPKPFSAKQGGCRKVLPRLPIPGEPHPRYSLGNEQLNALGFKVCLWDLRLTSYPSHTLS